MTSGTQPRQPLQQIWARALEQLQLQMTRATFEAWLKQTALISIEANNVYVVETKNGFAKDWLENRLSTTIQRALAGIAGTDVTLKFVTGPPDGSLLPDDKAAPAGPPPVLTPSDLPFEAHLSDNKAVHFVEAVDFEHLWLKTGFTQVPDYAIRYWRLYLGRAFDLWEFLISEDKRVVK